MNTEELIRDSKCLSASRRRLVVSFVLILFVAFGLRVWNLGARSIWYDEGYTLAVAEEVWKGENLLSPDISVEPPLLAILVTAETWAADLLGLNNGFWPRDAWVKLVSVFASTGAVLLAWAAFRRLFKNEDAALLGALLIAISPFQIYYAQELRAYALYVFFSTMLLYAGIRAMEENRPIWWVGVCLSMILMLYTHFFSVWNIAFFNLFFLAVILVRRDRFAPWLISQTTAFVLSLPSLLLMLQISATYEKVTNVYTHLPDYKFAFLTIKAFLAGYSPNTLLYEPLFLVSIGLFMLGCWKLHRRSAVAGMLFVLAIMPMFVNVLVWRLRHFPMYEHRLFLFSGLVACGVMGLGLSAIKPRLLKFTVCAAVFMLMAPCIADYYAQRLHPLEIHRGGVRHKVDSRGAARLIGERLQPGDLVAHGSSFTYLPLVYYLNGSGLDQCDLRMTAGELAGFLGAYPNVRVWEHYGMIPKMLPRVAEGRRRVWYVESWWERAIPPHVQNMRQWFDSHARRLDHRQFDGVSVTLYGLGNGEEGVI